MKLDQAILQLNKTHPNDFTKVLDVFPYGTETTAKQAGNVIDEAMKKFSGTIQLHNIGEYTDDAYFQIAKCYFFKQDYYSAMDAFQYMIGKYPKEYKQISTAWVAKCFMGMDKTEEAEAIINLLVAEKNFSARDIGEIFATAAAINVKLEKYKQAIDQLNRALTGKINREEKIRYHFILGQLYATQNKTNEAIVHFDKCIKLIPAYDFAFNATIQITRLYDPKNKTVVNKVRRRLKDMADDEKNTDYLDQVYYEMGMVEIGQKNYDLAAQYLRKSVSKSTVNKLQKTRSYYELAQLYFMRKDYKNAQAYYDSTSAAMDKKDKKYEQIKIFKTVLTDLVNNLKVYEKDDSLLALSKLSKEALTQKVDEWIAFDKKQKELDAKQRKKQEKALESMQANQQESGTDPLAILNANPENANVWYFYNTNLVSQGRLEFMGYRKWGQRANEDFWRIASKEKPKNTDTGSAEVGVKTDSTKTDEGDKSDPNKPTRKTGKEIHDEIVAEQKAKNPTLTGDAVKDLWIKDVPFSLKAKDNCNNRILEALHNLGRIYYEKLKDYPSSLKYYNELQNRFPESEYEAETFYYLSRLYSDMKKDKEALFYKNELIRKYPDHPYAQLIQGKPIRTVDNDMNKALVQFYEKMYMAFDSGQYVRVHTLKRESMEKFPGNSFQARIDYLDALATAKTDSLPVFIQSLKDIVDHYKGTEFAGQATATLNKILKIEKKKQLTGDDTALNNFNMEIMPEAPMNYIIAIKNDKIDFTIVNEKYAEFNEGYFSNDNLRTNTMLTNDGYQILLVREFADMKKGVNYIKTLDAVKVREQCGLTKDYIEVMISSANFKTVMKDKSLELYQRLYRKQLASLGKADVNAGKEPAKEPAKEPGIVPPNDNPDAPANPNEKR